MLNGLSKIEQNDDLPPVHLWKPDFCGDIDIVIKSNGEWWHEGKLITRPAMVKMFSRILWCEEGEHFLVTPVEKVRVQVEDAPFLITQYGQFSEDGLEFIELLTNTNDKLVLGQDECCLWMGDFGSETRPYVSMRYGMKAMLSRSVFYGLVELGSLEWINGCQHLCVKSGDASFSLGDTNG